MALRKLKNKKVAGPNGMIGETLKNSGSYVPDFFVKCFSALFEKRVFPERWSEPIVLPLFFFFLRKVMLTILIIIEVFHYVMLAVRFTVQLLILDYKSGLR